MAKNGQQLSLIPFADFTAASGDVQAQIATAVNTLNDHVQNVSIGKKCSAEFLLLVTKAQTAASAARAEEAYLAVWEATFLINRAIRTSQSLALRTKLALSPVGTFLLLLLFEWITRWSGMPQWEGTVLLRDYFPYLWLGAAGGTLMVFWGLVRHTIELDFDENYAFWYLFKPLLGAGMAAMAVLIVQAGMFSMGQAVQEPRNKVPLYILAFAVGFSERFFIQLIDRVFTALFGGNAAQTRTRVVVTPPGDGSGNSGAGKGGNQGGGGASGSGGNGQGGNAAPDGQQVKPGEQGKQNDGGEQKKQGEGAGS